jgi:hypothetical protein
VEVYSGAVSINLGQREYTLSLFPSFGSFSGYINFIKTYRNSYPQIYEIIGGQSAIKAAGAALDLPLTPFPLPKESDQ